jgi:hypothetical protein
MEDLKDNEYNGNSNVFKYKKGYKNNIKSIKMDKLPRLEQMATLLTFKTSKPIYTIDIIIILWAQHLQYFTRSHLMESTQFLSLKRSYSFLKRLVDNGILKKVRLQLIGANNQNVYYLSSIGIDFAKKIEEFLLKD